MKSKFIFCPLLILAIILVPSSTPAQTKSKSGQSSTQNYEPISVAIILDMSSSSKGSDSRPKYKVLFRLLEQYVRGNSQNEYFIVAFFTSPQLLADGSSDIPTILNVLKKLSPAKPDGPTMLYDACYLGISKVAQGKHSKQRVLVFSDGLDTLSDKTLEDVKRLVNDTKVGLYAVNMSYPIILSLDKEYIKGVKVLNELASSSGGVAVHPKTPADVESSFKSIIKKATR